MNENIRIVVNNDPKQNPTVGFACDRLPSPEERTGSVAWAAYANQTAIPDYMTPEYRAHSNNVARAYLMRNNPRNTRLDDNYRGYSISYSASRPVTGTWRTVRYGVGLCASSREALQRMIDAKIRAEAADIIADIAAKSCLVCGGSGC